jgi:hypothetical protein
MMVKDDRLTPKGRDLLKLTTAHVGKNDKLVPLVSQPVEPFRERVSHERRMKIKASTDKHFAKDSGGSDPVRIIMRHDTDTGPRWEGQ